MGKHVLFVFSSSNDDAATPLLWRFPKSWNPFNVKSFLTDISLSVAQIKKIQKTRWFYFLILLLGGPSPPSQLVPSPFNWSPNTVFYRYLSLCLSLVVSVCLCLCLSLSVSVSVSHCR